MHCRFCNTELSNILINLVNAPASNSFLEQQDLNRVEPFYPLTVFTCHNCFLVQVDEYAKFDTIFNQEYVYFSSYSSSWLAHAKRYSDLVTERFKLNGASKVIEIASNDGYLLQYFKEKGIPVLGVEPTANTASEAQKKGIETITRFFGRELATELADQNQFADLIIGNNVLAHVPDIVDFVSGLPIILKPAGVVTFEFPHLVQLIDNNQFDTIYHEHFSYLSFYTVNKIFKSCNLSIFDVEEIPTHGGSLRVYGKHTLDNTKPVSQRVDSLLARELEKGVNTLEYYSDFSERCLKIKLDFLSFLIEQKKNGKRVAAYGAAAKGNTLLNYCGVKNDLIDFVVDANPHKRNKWLPGSHIPVVDEEHLRRTKPDYIIIFPWNIQEEIIHQLHYIKSWGGRFVVSIPQLKLLP